MPPVGLVGGPSGHVLTFPGVVLGMGVPFKGQKLLSTSPWFCIAGVPLGLCGSKIKAKERWDLKERVPSMVL